jgi:type II secretory pathway pseudopilin PulG
MLRRNFRTDDGLSLVEMLVTIIMFTLIVGSITTVVITSLKHQRSLSDRGSALAAARNSLEQVDRDIRSANPLCSATGTDIKMFEDDPTSHPSIVDYTVSGTSLLYTQYSVVPVVGPSATCTVTTSSSGTLSTAYYNTSTALVSGRTVLTNLVSPTRVFSLMPSGTVFDTCPTTGADPTGTAVGTIPALIVSVSVKPPTLNSPVAVSDCGTYLRNYNIVPTT